MLQHSRGTDRQELPYTQTSLLRERNFLGARGERAVAAMQE